MEEPPRPDEPVGAREPVESTDVPDHPLLLLVRHGETVWSATGRHTSHTDVPLTDRGEAAARALRPLITTLLRGRSPALVLTSPLRRAAHTAELAGFTAEIDPDLREVGYGQYEGVTTPEIRREHPGWTVWTAPVPDGEPFSGVATRVDRALDRVRPALSHGSVVLFSHGHLLRVLTARWLGLSPDAGRIFALSTGSVCVLDTEHGSPVVRRWNLSPGLLR